ncbi:MAG: carbon-monoxide dehydrogenase medium subunit [Alteromonas macleodii]|jgi:carbon-monoxide dehydrogenase medium subunit
MYNFKMTRPSTIGEAVEALKQEDAQALGGGQTLIPTLKQRLAMPSILVSLTSILEMEGVYMSNVNEVCIGGATTHATVSRKAKAYPGLAALAAHIGDPAVRNRGTIGGSLANNDPSACFPAAVLASGANIITNIRKISADDYFQGMFTTALEEDEVITEVRFPVPEKSHYEKFVQPASRFALVGVMVAKYAGGVRVAVTGASESGVFRWTAAETVLSVDFLADALDCLSLNGDGMITDVHGSGAYRAHLVKIMTGRAVKAAA